MNEFLGVSGQDRLPTTRTRLPTSRVDSTWHDTRLRLPEQRRQLRIALESSRRSLQSVDAVASAGERYLATAHSPYGMIAAVPVDLPEDYSDFKSSVLSDAQAEGLGLYEVWWEANSRYPELPVSHRLAIAERLVSDLLEQGLVCLVRGKRIGPSHEREQVPEADTALMLRSWATWVPQEQDVVWLDGTGKHEAAGNTERS